MVLPLTLPSVTVNVNRCQDVVSEFDCVLESTDDEPPAPKFCRKRQPSETAALAFA
jgi:hypothetical protein